MLRATNITIQRAVANGQDTRGGLRRGPLTTIMSTVHTMRNTRLSLKSLNVQRLGLRLRWMLRFRSRGGRRWTSSAAWCGAPTRSWWPPGGCCCSPRAASARSSRATRTRGGRARRTRWSSRARDQSRDRS